MEYAPSCARVVVVLSRDFLKHEWSHYQVQNMKMFERIVSMIFSL